MTHEENNKNDKIMTEVELLPLELSDREQFIKDNQEAFNYGALEEFGRRDDHFEDDGEIISRDTISRAIDEGTAYRIMHDGKPVGGAVIKTAYDCGELELLFVSPTVHSKGIGYETWCKIEAMHPEVTVWETVTPYFEKRNIHFYVNRCGFHIVEFYNTHHCDPNDKDRELFEMFRFEKLLPTTPESVREQVKRITYYENIMHLAETGSSEHLRQLSDYYSSDSWKRDFAADEAGLLPKELRRGVLSEDGIYDLLEKFTQ
ncbi:MAG: GNAT family N-acetyltransferase [Ruminococcus sp.]|uniref:GNAT family N-acetyltransferase n=1 Tax=Ruminococcus sp. TaxID=41978 RepID=UPI0025D121A2|nr:GNAT family N-acetyltransferase [Ruminococcus sp.]MCR5599977.1 GNAT family N-acetyltransferase [Ruminococcus sp.]